MMLTAPTTAWIKLVANLLNYPPDCFDRELIARLVEFLAGHSTSEKLPKMLEPLSEYWDQYITPELIGQNIRDEVEVQCYEKFKSQILGDNKYIMIDYE